MGAVPSSIFDPRQKIWFGPKKQMLYNENVSIGQLLYTNLAAHPKNIQQINHTEQTTLTNEAVLSMSRNIALNLQEMGLTSGDFIGIMASNTTYLMPVLFGSLFLNVPCHPIDPTFSKEAIEHSWSKTKPKIIFCEGKLVQMVKKAIFDIGLKCDIYTLNGEVKGIKKVEDLFVAKTNDESNFQPLEIESSDQTAIVLCSSGSTGLSKAVTISHKYWTQLFSIL